MHVYRQWGIWHFIWQGHRQRQRQRQRRLQRQRQKYWKDPTCAIFLKRIWLKDIKYDDGGWISDDALGVMRRGWCTRDDAPGMMHRGWCSGGDAAGVMHWGWFAGGDATVVMHQGCASLGATVGAKMHVFLEKFQKGGGGGGHFRSKKLHCRFFWVQNGIF